MTLNIIFIFTHTHIHALTNCVHGYILRPLIDQGLHNQTVVGPTNCINY